jgi:hypothetical protein
MHHTQQKEITIMDTCDLVSSLQELPETAAIETDGFQSTTDGGGGGKGCSLLTIF